MKYFMMSRRFDKCKPEDFGLTSYNEDTFILKSDKSLWKSCELYDFGWGPENGFYRLPNIEFNELLELGVTTNDQDNLYGAAAFILNNFQTELLQKVEHIIKTKQIKRYKKFLLLMHLDNPINRTFEIGQDLNIVKSQSERWKYIAITLKNS